MGQELDQLFILPCYVSLCYMYIKITYQHNNDIYYMIQYDTHQYVTVLIIRYKRHAHIYSYHMYNAIYKYAKQKKQSRYADQCYQLESYPHG